MTLKFENWKLRKILILAFKMDQKVVNRSMGRWRLAIRKSLQKLCRLISDKKLLRVDPKAIGLYKIMTYEW